LTLKQPATRRILPLPPLVVAAGLALLLTPVAALGCLRLPAVDHVPLALCAVFLTLLALFARLELALITCAAVAVGLLFGLACLGLGAPLPVGLTLIAVLAALLVAAATVLCRAYLHRFRGGDDRVVVTSTVLVLAVAIVTLAWRQNGENVPAPLEHGWLALPGGTLGVLLVLPALCRAVLMRGGPNGTATLRRAYGSLWIFWVIFSHGVRFLLFGRPRAAGVERQRAAVACLHRMSLRLRRDVPLGTRGYLCEDRLPRSGPFVLVANHESMYDIVAVLALPLPVHVLVKRWVWRAPLMGRMVQAAGYVLLEENEPERMIERAARSLEHGFSLLVFPEGTRTETGKMRRFRNGGFAIARARGVPVVPIAMVNTREVVPRGSWCLGDHDSRVVVLDPMDPADYSGEGADRRMARDARDRIRACCREVWPQTQQGPDWWRVPAGMYRHLGVLLGTWASLATRLDPFIAALPRLCEGTARILVIDCGFGLATTRLALAYPERPITAIDGDDRKLRAARVALGDRFPVELVAGDPAELQLPPAEWTVLIDSLSARSEAGATRLLERLAAAQPAGSRLLVREACRDSDVRRRRLLELLERGACWTQGARPPSRKNVRRVEDWCGLLARSGFRVDEVRAETFAPPDVLFVCTRVPSPASAHDTTDGYDERQDRT
jgi:1-acyl-sn-glycerol-3-phosphate acyltransferase